MSNQRSCFKVDGQCLAVLLVTTVLLMTHRQCWAHNAGGFISNWLEMCNEIQRTSLCEFATASGIVLSSVAA